jgi:acyl carrier protein
MSVEHHARDAIREKVITLAARRGVDATSLADTDVIPETGALDSVAIIELIVWIESTFGRTIEQSELTLENFGTVNAMVGYLERTN